MYEIYVFGTEEYEFHYDQNPHPYHRYKTRKQLKIRAFEDTLATYTRKSEKMADAQEESDLLAGHPPAGEILYTNERVAGTLRKAF